MANDFEATLLNDVINGLAKTSIDTLDELTAYTGIIHKVMQIASGNTQSITRQELNSLGLNDGAGHTFTDYNASTNDYWITALEFARFTASTGAANNGAIGAAGGMGNVDTLQELQNVLSQAIINA